MNRLKYLRKEKHLTLRELAQKVNINHVTLSRIENGLQGITVVAKTHLDKAHYCIFIWR